MTESHEQASINHPIRRLRRHLPYLGKVKHQAASPQFPSLPFQALRASFPEGKPSRVRFEEHVGLTDERNLGQLRKSLPEVRAGAEGDGGAVLSYKSKVSLKVNLSRRGAAKRRRGCLTCKSKMRKKVQAQGSAHGTYEAD